MSTRVLLTVGVAVVLTLPWTGTAGAAGAQPGSLECGSWVVQTSQDPGGKSVLYGVSAPSTTDVWAVGQTTSGQTTDTLIEHFDGSAWSVVPSPNPVRAYNQLQAVYARTASDAWAVGDAQPSAVEGTLIEHWDGTAWTVTPSPNPSTLIDSLTAVSATSADHAWAVGFFISNVNGANQTLTEHWDGTAWTVVPSPSPGSFDYLYGVTSVASNDAWAVGSTSNGNTGTPLTEHWDGTAWSIVSNPGAGKLTAVTSVSSDDVWAVGDQGLGEHDVSMAERWDGSTWQVVHTPTNRPTGPLAGVAATSHRRGWAVGSKVGAGGVTRTLIERWNGQGWAAAASPNGSDFDNQLYAVATATATTSSWAVGFSTDSSRVIHPLVETFC